jgi:ribosomal protein S18 acetylase RimI-like enzyme
VTPPAPAVRRAGAGDLDPLASLWTALGEHHAELDPAFALRPDAAPEIRRLLLAQLRDPEAAFFLWEEGGRALGFAQVRVDAAPPILVETRRAEIVDLAVRADARRRGIGSALLAAALDWVRDRDVERVEVRVAAANAAGQGFWRARGFGDWMDVLHRRL